MENPLKLQDFSGFSGPSDWFRTSGLVVPNRNRKLFPDVSNGFLSFPLVFRYSRDLFGTPISACSARVCSNPCGQKTLPDKKTGSVSAFIICPIRRNTVSYLRHCHPYRRTTRNQSGIHGSERSHRTHQVNASCQQCS